MSTRRWLDFAAVLTGAAILFMAFAAWRSAHPLPPSAEEIRARTAAEINRIEARAAELERNAAQ
ncbi:hypothetical protein [Sphingomonas soli]|uniref:hypothetical protein n=1 Tax=Sphingomonas soli TaxID=266127 RepID=UPI000836368C|nr:hypothetical protein [Sphingomonas soli]